MKAKCMWCSRKNVEVTPKGGLGPHVDAAGKRCIGTGMKVANETRTAPRAIKGPYQRNRSRR